MEGRCESCPFSILDEDQKTYLCRNPQAVIAFMGSLREPFFGCSEHPLNQRDRLAAMAMQGMCSRANFEDSSSGIFEALALDAYEMANEMLNAMRVPPETHND